MGVQETGKTRKYELRARAERQAQTRERITEAAVDLHGTVGPARTTISAIADRAGVQRLTVYRHFPDEAALIDACSAHWMERNPPPDPGAWAADRDPERRLRTALDDLYRYFAGTEAMLANIIRDRDAIPRLAEQVGEFEGFLDACAGILSAGWGARGRRRRLLEAAIRHAVDFAAWQALARRGTAHADAVELMTRLAACARGAASARSGRG